MHQIMLCVNTPHEYERPTITLGGLATDDKNEAERIATMINHALAAARLYARCSAQTVPLSATDKIEVGLLKFALSTQGEK